MPSRHLTVAALAAALLLAGCSGDEGTVSTTAAPTTATPTTAAPTTVTPTTAAPTTVATGPVEPLFPSVSGFVAAYTAIGGSGATEGTEFALTLDGLTTGEIDNEFGETGFISLDAIPSGAVGGAVDADGAVTAAFVFLDPFTSTAAPAVLSLLGATIATPAEFDQGAFAQEYRALALEASARAGDQIWYPSTNGSGHSLVITIVEGAGGSNNLIEVAIVPIADEQAAKDAVKPLRNAVFALVA